MIPEMVRYSDQKNKTLSLIIATLLFTSIGANAQVSFDNVTSTHGPFHTGESWGASWGDINGDYYPDIAVNNHRERHSLWINKAGNGFVDRILQFDANRVFTSAETINHDSHGTTFADIDNDGDQDLFAAKSSPQGHVQLFINDQAVGHERSAKQGLGGVVMAGRLTSTYDYNQDGLLDLFYASKWINRNRIFKNNGGSFTDVTPLNFATKCRTANYFQFSEIARDFSGLQNLEIACVKEGNFPQSVLDASGGTTNFADVTSVLPNSSNTVDTVFADFDNDGDNDVLALKGTIRPNGVSLVAPDKMEGVFITSGAGGDKSFKFGSAESITIEDYQVIYGAAAVTRLRVGSGNITVSSLPITLDKNQASAQGISTSTADGTYIGYDAAAGKWKVRFKSRRNVNHYFVLKGQGLSEPEQIVVAARDLPSSPLMMRNLETGFKLEYRTGIEDIGCSSLASGDIDNDMDIDLYFACASGVENHPNRIYLNDGTGKFTFVATHGAEGPIGKGIEQGAGVADSVIVADYDIDGRLDFFTTNGALLLPAGAGGPDGLFRNTTQNSNSWIQLDLVGVAVNRDAVGAKVTATAGGVTQMREQNGGYHRWSQNHKRIHFGLGTNQVVDIKVDWPDGTQDNFAGLNANGLYELTQGQAAQPITVGDHIDYPEPQQGDECGTRDQAYSAGLDRAVFMYKDCDAGTWRLRAVSGGSEQTVKFTGHILSGEPIANTSNYSLEGSDFVTVTGRRIDFSLSMSGVGEDGFDFNLVETAEACIQIDNDETLYVGEGHLIAPLPLNLMQMGRCEVDANGGLLVLPSKSISVATQSFTIPGGGGNSTELVDLSAHGIQIGQVVRVKSVMADGDLNGSKEYFSLRFNGGEFVTKNLTTTNDCAGVRMPVTPSVQQNVRAIDIGGGVPGIRILGTTSAAVNINESCSDVAYSLTVTWSIENTDTPPLVCGRPDHSAAEDKGLFVWRDCEDTGKWFMRATAGGGVATTYQGTLISNSAISAVTPYLFEGIDAYSMANADKELDFTMRMSASGLDGLEFDLASTSELCLSLADSNQQIFVGALGASFSSPLNLNDLSANCAAAAPALSVSDAVASESDASVDVLVSLDKSSDSLVSVSYATEAGSASADTDYTSVKGVLEFQPGEMSKIVSIPLLQDSEVESVEYFSLVLSNPQNADLLQADGQIFIDDDEIDVCGEPSYSPSTDAGVYLWQDCEDTNKWKIRATAGGGTAITYTAVVTASGPLGDIETYSFEGVDNYQLSTDAQQLDFEVKMANSGVDGIEFSAPLVGACFEVLLPADQPVVVGQNNALLSPPFNLQTLDPC